MPNSEYKYMFFEKGIASVLFFFSSIFVSCRSKFLPLSASPESALTPFYSLIAFNINPLVFKYQSISPFITISISHISITFNRCRIYGYYALPVERGQRKKKLLSHVPSRVALQHIKFLYFRQFTMIRPFCQLCVRRFAIN